MYFLRLGSRAVRGLLWALPLLRVAVCETNMTANMTGGALTNSTDTHTAASNTTDDDSVYCLCNGFKNCFNCYYSSNDTVINSTEKTCCDNDDLDCDASAFSGARFSPETYGQVCLEKDAGELHSDIGSSTRPSSSSKNQRVWCQCIPHRGCYACFHTDPSGTPGPNDLRFLPKESLFCCEEDGVGCSRDEEPSFWGEWPACERVTLRKVATFAAPYRQRTLAILSGLSAILSVAGSGCIVFCVFTRWRRSGHATTRDRILLSMSVFDMIGSIAFGLGPLPTPPHTVDMVGAVGNTATCAIQGMGVQLGISVVPLYNSMLCIYFMLVAGYQVDEKVIAGSGAEIILHGIPLLYGIATAVTGLSLRLFNPNSNVCWIQPYPYNCINHAFPCTRWLESLNFQLILFFFAAGLFVSLPIIVIAMSTMSWKIYRARQDFRRRFGSSSLNDNNQVASVCTQAFLYVAAFLLTYLPGLLPQLIYATPWKVTSKGDFVIHVIHRFFQPLQGFWNFFIFIRPTYQRVRRKPNANLSKWGSLVKAIQLESTEARRAPRGGSSRSVRSLTSSRGSFELSFSWRPGEKKSKSNAPPMAASLPNQEE